MSRSRCTLDPMDSIARVSLPTPQVERTHFNGRLSLSFFIVPLSIYREWFIFFTITRIAEDWPLSSPKMYRHHDVQCSMFSLDWTQVSFGAWQQRSGSFLVHVFVVFNLAIIIIPFLSFPHYSACITVEITSPISTSKFSTSLIKTKSRKKPERSHVASWSDSEIRRCMNVPLFR